MMFNDLENTTAEDVFIELRRVCYDLAYDKCKHDMVVYISLKVCADRGIFDLMTLMMDKVNKVYFLLTRDGYVFPCENYSQLRNVANSNSNCFVAGRIDHGLGYTLEWVEAV